MGRARHRSLGKIIAAHAARHHDVSEQQINRLVLNLEGGGAVRRIEHMVTKFLELPDNNAPQALVVLDSQDGLIALARSRRGQSPAHPRRSWRVADRGGMWCHGPLRYRH